MLPWPLLQYTSHVSVITIQICIYGSGVDAWFQLAEHCFASRSTGWKSCSIRSLFDFVIICRLLFLSQCLSTVCDKGVQTMCRQTDVPTGRCEDKIFFRDDLPTTIGRCADKNYSVSQFVVTMVNKDFYISPGISPGAAAPLTFLSIKKCDNEVPVLAANGFSGLVVHEEIHLFGSDLFKLIFKGVYSFDVDCTLWQTVTTIQHTDREEVKSCVACIVSFNHAVSIRGHDCINIKLHLPTVRPYAQLVMVTLQQLSLYTIRYSSKNFSVLSKLQY